MAQEALRKRMLGHGSLMILSALVGGLGLWCFLLGGFEIVPGYIIAFQQVLQVGCVATQDRSQMALWLF
jgi:hypothetical protein